MLNPCLVLVALLFPNFRFSQRNPFEISIISIFKPKMGILKFFLWINDTQVQQVAPNPRLGRFSTETPLERDCRLQIQREQRRRRRQQETSEQKEHRLAQRRQRRQQETEEQEIGIRGIMIVYCRKPIPADICRSKSAKFQLCITARTIIIFRRTAPRWPYLFFVFVFF